MSNVPSPPTSPDGPIGERATQRGILEADRLCRTCLHQLAGQIVYHDRHLNLPYVRCPECGTIAAVTEYPVGGRWLRRFGTAVASILILLALAVLTADVAASCASIYEASWGAMYPYEEPLRKEAPAFAVNPTPQQVQQLDWMAPAELAQSSEILARIGSDPATRRLVSSRFFFDAIPAYITSIVSGIVWSALLLHRRLARAWLWTLVPSVLAVSITVFIWWVETRTTAIYGRGYRDLAFQNFGLPYLLLAAAMMTAIRAAAFLAARPMLLVVCRVFLPSKFRRAIADLWSDDKVATFTE
jgi:hypothetical protein